MAKQEQRSTGPSSTLCSAVVALQTIAENTSCYCMTKICKTFVHALQAIGLAPSTVNIQDALSLLPMPFCLSLAF